MAVGLVLMVGPTMRARAAEAAPLPSELHQRAAVVDAPTVELKALDDTLNFDQHLFARPNDAADVLMPSDGARSSAEAELDALTAATLAENAAHGATAYAPTWDNGVGGDVPAAEAELHALLAWQDSRNRAGSTPAKSLDREGAMAKGSDAISDAREDAPSGQPEAAGGPEPVFSDGLASDAHDDSGLSSGGAFDSKLGGRADHHGRDASTAAQSASAPIPTTALCTW